MKAGDSWASSNPYNRRHFVMGKDMWNAVLATLELFNHERREIISLNLCSIHAVNFNKLYIYMYIMHLHLSVVNSCVWDMEYLHMNKTHGSQLTRICTSNFICFWTVPSFFGCRIISSKNIRPFRDKKGIGTTIDTSKRYQRLDISFYFVCCVTYRCSKWNM